IPLPLPCAPFPSFHTSALSNSILPPLFSSLFLHFLISCFFLQSLYSSTCSSSHVSSFSSLLRASNLSTDCLSKPSSSCCSVLYNLTAVSMVNSLFLRLLFFFLLILLLLPCILLSHFPLHVSAFNPFP